MAGASTQHRSSVPPNLGPGICIAGRYELVRRLGSGAMGEVWEARHVSLVESVALKLVLRDFTHGDGSSADSRFLLEARVASQLSRKTRHILSVTDHGADGPYAYLAMELLDGESLEDRLARNGPMPLAKVVPLVYQIARALTVAHADGVIHRDLKPSNVFVTIDEDGKALVKILDFGIAKLRAALRGPAAKHSTLRGVLLGTPAYMSPEHARGKVIDHRADVWALAVIAYHLLTGELPFDGDTPEELFLRLCSDAPVLPSKWRTDLPPAIDDLFVRAFAPRIEQRFQSATAFAGALEHLETQLQRPRSVPSPIGIISLPPPPVTAQRAASESIQEPERATPRQLERKPTRAPAAFATSDSLVAAGVPKRRSGWRYLLGAAVVLAVFVVTGATLWVYFERDSARSGGAAVSARAIPTVAATQTRDDIPPPPEAEPSPLIRTADLPSAQPAPPSGSRPTEPKVTEPKVMEPKVAEPAKATEPKVTEPVTAAAPKSEQPAANPVAPPKTIDRSEVF